MAYYEHLLELDARGSGLSDEENLRLKRLICGYHATKFFFDKLVKPADRVADVGCYFGQWSYPLLAMAKEVAFIDYMDEKFAYIKKLIPAAAESGQLIVHDFTEVPLKGEKFDLIICLETLHYIDQAELERFCSNMLASLNDGGYLLVDGPINERFDIYHKFILRLKRSMLLFYPYLKHRLSLSHSGLVDKVRLAGQHFADLMAQYASIFFSSWLSKGQQERLREFLQRKPYFTVKGLKNILNRLGLEELDYKAFFDIGTYEILRNIEGYNLTNTFVGNYFWVSLYQKPVSDITTMHAREKS